MKRFIRKCVEGVIMTFAGIICGAAVIIVIATGLIGELVVYLGDFILMLREPKIYE